MSKKIYILITTLFIAHTLFSQHIAKGLLNRTTISSSGTIEGGTTTNTIHRIVILQNKVQLADLHTEEDSRHKYIFNAGDTLSFEYSSYRPYIGPPDIINPEEVKHKPIIEIYGKQIHLIFKHYPANDTIKTYTFMHNGTSETITLPQKILKEWALP